MFDSKFKISVRFQIKKKNGMDVISNAKNAKAVCLEGGEENNNDIKPPVSFRSGSWKHLSFRVNVHNGKEVVEKEIKNVGKLCHNDASYKSGNICNMSSHLRRKHGIGFLSTASPSASNNSKSDTSVITLLLPRQRLLLANYVKKNLQETFACQSKFSNKSPKARTITGI